MKRNLLIWLIIVGICPIHTFSSEKDWHELAPGLIWGGSLRLRGEIKDDFKFDPSVRGNDEEYLLSQLRLNLKWEAADWLTFFVEGQDARIFGEEAINEDAVPTIFADEFDLHQGYIDLNYSLSDIPLRLRTGRQKFNFGAQRLLASLEWVNTARVWDGVRLTAGTNGDRTLDVFASRLVTVDNGNWNDWAKTGNRLFDSDFHGLYYTDWQLIPNTQFEAYWLFRHESNIDDEIHTLGSRFDTQLGDWDFNGELAGQWGDYGALDHEAMMAHIEVGYTVQAFNQSRFAVAYNYGSGDDDPTDGTHNTFDNLYPLNHAYYGYMDLFALQNIHNAEVSFKTRLWETLPVRLAYQGFWLAEEDTDAWYNAGAGPVRNAGGSDVDSYVGSEIDLTVKYAITQSINVEAGYSHFFAGNYVDDTGPSRDADFVYLQSKINF